MNYEVILNFHGGGFIKGRSDRDHRYCSFLANEVNCLVWDVDYALAPENPFPAGLMECYNITEYVFLHANELGVDPDRIALAGHSAGGNFVAAAMILAARNRSFRPDCLLMEYFPTDQQRDAAGKLSPELAAFPDSLIINAGKDTLQKETEEFARVLVEQGVTVLQKRIPEAMHGFTTNRTDGWERALALHRDFFRQHFTDSRS